MRGLVLHVPVGLLRGASILLAVWVAAGCSGGSTLPETAAPSNTDLLTERATEWTQVLASLPSTNEEGDVALIASYLDPNADATTRAREFYANWTGPDSQTSISSTVAYVELSDDQRRGTVVYVATYLSREGYTGTVSEETQWTRVDGTWYRATEPAVVTILSSEPTPTPAPTPTPTSPPTPAPLATPKRYQGTGDDVIKIVKPGSPSAPVIAYVRGNTESHHFAVWGIDEYGDRTDLLVNAIEPYEGIVALDFSDGQVTARLGVTATGNWYIELRPLGSARTAQAPGVAWGKGDEVFLVTGRTDTVYVTGNSTARHFAVWAYGDTKDLLVNTTEPYAGRTLLPRGTFLIEVTAVGEWAITFE